MIENMPHTSTAHEMFTFVYRRQRRSAWLPARFEPHSHGQVITTPTRSTSKDGYGPLG